MHIQQQIRNNISTLLNSLDIFATVTEDRQYLIATDKFPAVWVASEDEEVEEAAKQKGCVPQAQKRHYYTALYILIQANEGLQNELDKVQEAVEKAIAADPSLQGAAEKTILKRVNNLFAEDNEYVNTPVGAKRLLFISTVHTMSTDPTKALHQ